MSYRLSPLETPVDDPFKNDALERAEIVDFLLGIIERSDEHPLVLAIDAPYGSGKSTFVEMMQIMLERKGFQTVSFDAWRSDHVNDPLVAMVAALDDAIPKETSAGDRIKRSLSIVRKVTGKVAKRGIVAAAKVATMGAVDLEDDVEEVLRDFAGEATADLVGDFQREEKLILSFRGALEKAIKQLPDTGKKKQLVFFIDELDRCRPDFAISLLERVKHMFDVPNIVFVLSVDKAQLEATTAAIYGERINAAEYLRKFIDLEFGLPAPSSMLFLDRAITRIGLDETFAARNSSETKYDRQNSIKVLFVLSKIFNLSLRSQERCVTRLKLVLEQTKPNEYLDPEHVGLLLVLRLVNQEMFDKVVQRTVSPDELLEFIHARPNAHRILSSEEGRVLHALILAEDPDPNRLRNRITSMQTQFNSITAPGGDDYDDLFHKIQLVQHFSRGGSNRSGASFLRAARKIDIAMRIRE
jgi:hypothetical protein